MFALLDPSTSADAWAPLWAQTTYEMLTSLATLEAEGEANWGDELDAWVTEHGFEESLGALVDAAFARSHADFERGVAAFSDLVGEDDPHDLLGRLFEALEGGAAVGTWFDPEGGDGSFGVDLSGETILFGIGYTLTCPLDAVQRTISDSRQLDAIAGALVRDAQVIAGHRLVLLPVLLDANAREQLDEWHANRIRVALEDWMALNSNGHPQAHEAWAMLRTGGFDYADEDKVKYATLDGKPAVQTTATGYGVQTWMLVGLLARPPVVPNTTAPFVLENVSFPRSEIGPVLESLASESERIGRDLELAEERGSYEAQKFLMEEAQRLEREVRAIEAAYGQVVNAKPQPGGNPHTAMENLVQRAITTRALEPSVETLTPANEFFVAWRNVVYNHRKVAFQALLLVAALNAGREDLKGMRAAIAPGNDSTEIQVRLTTEDGKSSGKLPWPAVPWQSSYESMAELLKVLRAYELQITP